MKKNKIEKISKSTLLPTLLLLNNHILIEKINNICGKSQGPKVLFKEGDIEIGDTVVYKQNCGTKINMKYVKDFKSKDYFIIHTSDILGKVSLMPKQEE